MSNILEQTETGRDIARKNREEGHVDSMRAALARILAGATLDDLRT